MNESREGEDVDRDDDGEVPNNIGGFSVIMEKGAEINDNEETDGEFCRNGIGKEETRFADRNCEEKPNNPRRQSAF